MSYLCKKTVTLFGNVYQPGDIIPVEAVLSHRVRALRTCGYIADAPASDTASDAESHKSPKTEAKGPASTTHTTKGSNKAHTASKRPTTSGKE